VAALAWTPVAGVSGGYSAPDPDNPGQYLYYGPDQQVYRDAYPGEVHPGDVSKDKVGTLSTVLQQYPGSSKGGSTTQSGAADGGAGTSAPGQSALQPSYLSTLFPNGIPQDTAATVGSVPSVGTSTVTAPSTSSIVDSIQAGLAPQFAQQDQAETEALANAGIVGGSTTGALGALGLQQQQQAMSEEAPYILQGDQMGLTAQQTNAGNTLTASEQNAGNALSGGEFNASSENAAGNNNVANELGAGEFDIGQGTNASEYLAGIQNQDYLSQLGLQGNVITEGEGAQTGAYQPVYSQPSAPNYTGLASAIAPQPANNTISPNANEEDYSGDSEANAYNPYGATVGGD
jgi:hypothetical protein